MILASFLSLALILITVVIHYQGLCWLSCFYRSVFFLLHHYSTNGGFTEAFEATVWNYVYFSGVNYTTLGMSEFYPTGHFKVLAFTEALNGFMMLTWSATFFYSLAGQFFQNPDSQ